MEEDVTNVVPRSNFTLFKGMAQGEPQKLSILDS